MLHSRATEAPWDGGARRRRYGHSFTGGDGEVLRYRGPDQPDSGLATKHVRGVEASAVPLEVDGVGALGAEGGRAGDPQPRSGAARTATGQPRTSGQDGNHSDDVGCGAANPAGRGGTSAPPQPDCHPVDNQGGRGIYRGQWRPVLHGEGRPDSHSGMDVARPRP